MSTSDSPSSTLSISVKGPQDVKLTLAVPTTATVAELKQLVSEAATAFPADSQRLIYSGRVLKDEDLISKYGLKDGHTIHLVSVLVIDVGRREAERGLLTCRPEFVVGRFWGGDERYECFCG
jgi:hypothetical protein